MSELGFGAGGMVEALQLYQSIQGNKLDQQGKQIELQMSQLQLDNMKKLQSQLGAQSFQAAMQGADPQAQSHAMTQLADTYLASNMPQQAKAVMDMNMNMITSKAYATEQQAMASKKYIDMAEELFSSVTSEKEWNAAQQLMQSQLPQEALQNPTVKGLLTGAYSQDKVKILPQFFDRLKTRAQAAADAARAHAEDARVKYYDFEERRDSAQADEAEARAENLRQLGASGFLPNKQEIDAVASDLQEKYPEPEAQPVTQGGKITDNTAVRSNYKARLQARALDIAQLAKQYTKNGMSAADARKRAIEESEARGELSTLKPLGSAPGTPAASPPPAPPQAGGNPSSGNPSNSWGDPSIG